MKKIKLDLSTLPGAEILSREQLKKVVGGMYSGGGCPKGKCNSADDCDTGQSCYGGNPVPDCSGTCGKKGTAGPPVEP